MWEECKQRRFFQRAEFLRVRLLVPHLGSIFFTNRFSTNAMRALEFITDNVIFKLCYDQIYQMKTTDVTIRNK